MQGWVSLNKKLHDTCMTTQTYGVRYILVVYLVLIADDCYQMNRSHVPVGRQCRLGPKSAYINFHTVNRHALLLE